jgi:hypothetical protein
LSVISMPARTVAVLAASRPERRRKAAWSERSHADVSAAPPSARASSGAAKIVSKTSAIAGNLAEAGNHVGV